MLPAVRHGLKRDDHSTRHRDGFMRWGSKPGHHGHRRENHGSAPEDIAAKGHLHSRSELELNDLLCSESFVLTIFL